MLCPALLPIANLRAHQAADPAREPSVLADPVAVLSGFDAIHQVLGLSNGTLLVTGTRSETPWVVDLRRGTSEPVSRSGDGPGKFRQLSSSVSAGADSSVVVDMNRRSVLDGAQPVLTLRAWLAGV